MSLGRVGRVVFYHQALIPHVDDVPQLQLSTPARLDLTVHQHLAGLDQQLGLAAGTANS